MSKKTETQIIKPDNKVISGDLTSDIRRLIETARHNVAVTVNAGLTLLYWQIGDRIRQHVLKKKRAEYGKEIVATLSRQLSWRQNLRSATPQHYKLPLLCFMYNTENLP